MSIILPEILYHGTTTKSLHIMKKELINKGYWKTGRDFGKGLYTTVNLAQAKVFANIKSNNPKNLPCVIKLKVENIDLSTYRKKIFLGASINWASLIYNHRIHEVGFSEYDLIVGPLADSSMRKVILECKLKQHSINWFYENVIRNKESKLIEDLGSQIVFSNGEFAKEVLSIDGWYIRSNGGWIYESVGKRDASSL
ncbi:hypothetical protein CR203_14330 [Salipaludibacillus neizhouensis]|uniref:DUF3990 domain-containing protein n=1 Tax=Salipaludibacillus neizhouensis TaxID=885475 RepID=A0A3A9KFS3_9BACI|nr:DUF3990 domain-containing protein [Salipaludibacillus neizhouensis]RKL66475.1 hypothetical protein CR203_14330 [Salipaludibacillus neizhouensis]